MPSAVPPGPISARPVTVRKPSGNSIFCSGVRLMPSANAALAQSSAATLNPANVFLIHGVSPCEIRLTAELKKQEAMRDLGRYAAAEERRQRIHQRVRPTGSKNHFGSKFMPAVAVRPSRSTTRRAIAGAGSIQASGHGASAEQPIQQQRVMRAGEHDGVSAQVPAVNGRNETWFDFAQDIGVADGLAAQGVLRQRSEVAAPTSVTVQACA